MRAFSLVLLIAALVGCRGPEGPAGPAGDQNRLVLSGVAGTNESVSVDLPAEPGLDDPLVPPGMVCYMAVTPQDGVWLLISDGDQTISSAYCALLWVNGRWRARMIGIPAGWTALFIITY